MGRSKIWIPDVDRLGRKVWVAGLVAVTLATVWGGVMLAGAVEAAFDSNGGRGIN